LLSSAADQQIIAPAWPVDRPFYEVIDRQERVM